MFSFGSVDQLNVWNPNKIFRILDEFKIWTILQPNKSCLSEIQTVYIVWISDVDCP